MKKQTMQGSLFQGMAQVETQVISHREDFEALFDGFTKMRAISYVVSSDLLREFFEKRGTEDNFLKYFENKEKGYAIKVEKARRYDAPIALRNLMVQWPPQSFTYLQPLW